MAQAKALAHQAIVERIKRLCVEAKNPKLGTLIELCELLAEIRLAPADIRHVVSELLAIAEMPHSQASRYSPDFPEFAVQAVLYLAIRLLSAEISSPTEPGMALGVLEGETFGRAL